MTEDRPPRYDHTTRVMPSGVTRGIWPPTDSSPWWLVICITHNAAAEVRSKKHAQLLALESFCPACASAQLFQLPAAVPFRERRLTA